MANNNKTELSQVLPHTPWARSFCPFSPFLNHLRKFSKNNRGRVISAMTFPLFWELQPLLSTNSGTSFYQIKCLIRATNTPLQANAVESSSQRSHIFKPTQSNLQANAVISSSQRSRIFKSTQSNLQASAVISSSQHKPLTFL